MQENDYALGGEQSGHIILKKYATTGDGLLTAIMVAEEVCDTKSTLSKLAEEVVLYPQYTKNVRVKDKKAVLKDENILKAVAEVERIIGGNGRALLRESGTEPVVRVMIESESEESCINLADKITLAIEEGGHCIEK
jgi:phosphoglucosamine mutase